MLSVVHGSSKEGTHLTRGGSGEKWEQELGEGHGEQHIDCWR